MTRTISFRLLPMVALVAAAVASPAALYDFAADFSIANGNPNGAWSYGARPTLTGARTVFTQTVTDYVGRDWWHGQTVSPFYIPSVFKQKTGTAEGLNTGEVAMHPGSVGEYASVLFTAPESGLLTLDSDMRSGLGHLVDFHVLLNGTPVYSQLAVSTSRSFDLTTPVPVTAGQTLEFLVGASTDGEGFDTTPVSAQINIQAVPEPATLATLTLGGLALLRRRTRKN